MKPTESVVYNPAQLKQVIRWLPSAPKWLLLGGPSNADEAQTAAGLWPEVRVLACEPSERLRRWQETWGFPRPPQGVLLPHALSDVVSSAVFWPVDGPSGGAMVEQPGISLAPVKVLTTTLDQLEHERGPFVDALLWLDIEGHELPALRGGAELLRSGRVLLINVEVCDRTPENTTAISKLLTACGYALRDHWNNSGPYHDEVWTR